MIEKQLRLRRADRCRACGLDLAEGSTQWWDPEARTVTCTVCHDSSEVAPPVSPSGVYVIDAKKYTGQIEARNVGGWVREDFRLYVNGRDQTKLADAMGHQVDVVRQAMGAEHSGFPVVPVLCFVAATWPGFRPRSFSIRGVAILWPVGLGKFVTRPSETTVGDPCVVAQTIGRYLRPA